MDFDVYAPFDAVQTGTDASGKPIYDRAHRAEDLRAVIKAIVSNGVPSAPSSNLQVVEATGMTATVKAGYIFAEGAVGRLKTDKTVTFDAADGVLHRIDAVVARVDYLARKPVVEVVKGTPASTPVAPALTRTVDKYEMALAYVRINAGATAITAANITDKRQDSTVCGIAGNLMSADTDTLFTQFDAAMAAFQAESEAEFNAWFETVQGSLAGDPAGQLATHLADTAAHMPTTETTEKATPVDADFIGLIDSADTNNVKKLSWSGIKETLKTYFEGLFAAKAPAQYTLILPTAGYFGTGPFTISIATAGVAVGQIHDIDWIRSTDAATRALEQEAWNCVTMIEEAADSFLVTCDVAVPTQAVNFRAIYKCDEAVS